MSIEVRETRVTTCDTCGRTSTFDPPETYPDGWYRDESGYDMCDGCVGDARVMADEKKSRELLPAGAPGPLVVVRWVDSVGAHSEWHSVKSMKSDGEPEEEMLCISVGFLAVEGERYLLVVPHVHSGSEDYGVMHAGCGDMWIPRVAVVDVERLR